MTKQVKPTARGTLNDEAEQWLRKNYPNYLQSKRKWIAPTTDALARARSETNEIHPTLESISEMVPKGQGNYHRRGGVQFHEPGDVLKELHSDEDAL